MSGRTTTEAIGERDQIGHELYVRRSDHKLLRARKQARGRRIRLRAAAAAYCIL